MSPLSDERVLRLLRAELPVPADQPSVTDLWPRVRSKVLQPAAPGPSALDWILVALVVISCVLSPSAIGMLLFHL
jgi:hypothetical protein